MKTSRPSSSRHERALATLDRWEDEPTTFDLFEDQLYEEVMEQERPVDAERHKVMALCDTVFLGAENQFIVPSKLDGFPMVEERDPDELFFIDDQFGPLVETNCTQFVRSRGVLKFAAPQGADDADGIARVATSVWVHYQEKLLRQDFLQREARRLMLHGGAWRYVFYDQHAGGSAKKPRTATVERQIVPSAFYCPECGAQGPLEQAEPPMGSAGSVEQENEYHSGPIVRERHVCPDCGHDDVVTVDVPHSEFDEQVGWDMEARGDLVVDQPDGYEMTTNSWARSWDETIFLRRKRRMDRGLLKALFRHAKLAEVDETDEDGTGVSYQRVIEVTYDVLDSIEDRVVRGPGTLGRECDYVEVWYMPSYYAGVTLSEDFILYPETEDELVLEAGVPLEEYFPSGMRVCKSGGEILGVYDEDFHKKFVYYRYRIAPGRFYGKGVEGAVSLQQWLNELVSLVMTFVMTSASPAFLFDESVMPDGMPPAGSPSQRIPIANRPMDVSLNDVIKIIPPGTLATGVFEMFVKIKEEMQSHIGAFSFFAGNLPEAAKSTATGLSIVQEQASGLMMMPLALRAEADARFGELVLACFRENVRDERYVMIAGPYAEAEMEGFFVSGDALPEGVTAIVEPHSYYPRMSYQLRQDALDFFAWRGEFIQTHQRVPTPVEEELMATRFGVPELINTAMVAGRRERQNFEAMRDYVDRFESGQLTPEEQTDLVETIEQQTMQIVQQAQMAMQAAQDMGVPPQPPDIQSMLPDPKSVVIQKALNLAPVWPEQDDHDAMISWLKKYANQDKGGRETHLIREMIEERIKQRKRAKALVAASEQGTVFDAMAPVMQKQAAFENEQVAAQAHAQSAARPEGPMQGRTPGDRARQEQQGEQAGARRNLPQLPYQRARGGAPAQAQSPVG